MKMYPIEGTKYSGKTEWVEVAKSICSEGKQLITFSDGTKIHLKDEDVGEFFQVKKSEPKPKPKPKSSSKSKQN